MLKLVIGWCVVKQMIDSHIAAVGRHVGSIIWRLSTYTLTLAMHLFIQVSISQRYVCLLALYTASESFSLASY